MRFQKSDNDWIVSIGRHQFPGAKKHWPSELTLGTISKARGIDVWPAPYGTQERGGGEPSNWRATAAQLLSSEAVRAKLFGAMKEHRKEERTSGRFVAKLSDGRSSAFHGAREAGDWLEKKLKAMPAGSKGGMFHDTGLYSTEPFSMLIKDEYGHIKQGDMRTWGAA